MSEEQQDFIKAIIALIILLIFLTNHFSENESL
jgi:hypothetical protein